MAKSFSTLKRAVGKLGYSNDDKSKEKKDFKDLKVSDYDFSLVQSDLEKKIGFHNFSSDLSTLNQTISDTYNGWQTPETMQNTKPSLESMYDRLGSFKTYQRLFGGEGNDALIDDLRGSYRKAIEGWDSLANEYGIYKNADAHSKEKAKLTELYSMNSSDIEPYLKDKNKSIAYTTATGENIKWQDLYNLAKTNEIESEVKKDKNFAENSKYEKKDVEYQRAWGSAYSVASDKDAHEYNYINKDQAAVEHEQLYSVLSYNTNDDEKDSYFQPNEIAVYNALAKTQGYDKAREYAKLLSPTLRKRRVEAERIHDAQMATESPFGTSFVSIINNVGNKMVDLPLMIGDAIDGDGIDENSSLYRGSRRVDTTRGTVESNIDSEIGKFFYRHGMNTADNLAIMAMSGGGKLGTVSKVLSGGLNASGAFTDTVLDAKSRGLSDEKAMTLGTISAAAEAYFESKSFESFFDSDTLSDSAWKYFLNNLKTETVGELATEGVGDMADILLSQDLSQWKLEIDSYKASGMTDKEAFNKAFKNATFNYLDVAAGTIFSAGALSGPSAIGGAVANHSANKTKGATIRSNERVGDMLDLASTMTPDEALAYEAYTKYAKKGVNADNITDAQLGRLYRNTQAEAVKGMYSKDTTKERQTRASATMNRLNEIDNDNIALKEAKAATQSGKENASNLTTGEVTEVASTGNSASIQGIKVEGNETTLITTEGEVKSGDMNFSAKDADLVGHAQFIAKEHGNDVGNVFLQQYDGKTEVEEYASAFNLVMNYAEKNYTQDTILARKGILSAEQATEIYTAVVHQQFDAQQKAIEKIVEKQGKNMTIEGTFDDSVIDYNNATTDGTKVNWSKLTSRQQSAVRFAKMFSKATGVNIRFTQSEVVNGKRKGENGSYNPNTNTIEIDVYAGIVDAKSINDSIIPTLSHEITHWAKYKSPAIYKVLRDEVMGTLAENGTMTSEKRIDEELARLKEAHPDQEFTEEDAIDEIIAKSCEDMLSNSNYARKMLNKLSPDEQKTFKEKIKETFDNLIQWVNDLLAKYKSESDEAELLRRYKDKLKKVSKTWDSMIESAVGANQALQKEGILGEQLSKAVSDTITSIGSRDLSELAKATDINGNKLFQYRAIETDKDIYRKMLLEHKETLGISEVDIDNLFNLIDMAVDIVKDNLEALDYAWEADIDDRAFVPVKPNSDSLYKVSLDFSTLCRKRLLQQTIQATLQEALDKQLSREESIAIRDELLKIQEEGKQIEVACALCYVESARMKSPEQIKKFLNNREKVIREFFANRSGGDIKQKIKDAEARAREDLNKANPNGMKGKHDKDINPLTSSLSAMSKADAEYIRNAKKEAKASYKLTEHEQAELDTALGLSVHDFTSAEGLENLAKNHKDLFDAYTSYIRNATHSKGIENDTWWRAGDSDLIGDNLIQQMNEENGLRSQSWSDFQVIHLLDYIAATIELSTKGAKRQSYTKVPDYVRLLGNTGDMINMSVIPTRAFTGKLEYDDVEGMAYKIAKELRERYHETAGIICIGMDNEQIRMLLADFTIDMVIPYHKSSMAKTVRKLMHIPSWKDYEPYQQEKNLSDDDAIANAKRYGVELVKNEKYHKAPKFSEWFNLEEARRIAKKNAKPSDVMYGGYMAMQNAANNYLKLCAERGISPKFSHPDADFTQEANYWKLLIDRKMVDNVTGEIIEQKAIKPIFKQEDVLGILNDELERYPSVKADQEYATRKVTEKFLSGEMEVDNSTKDAIKAMVDNVAKVNIVESGELLKKQNSDRNNIGYVFFPNTSESQINKLRLEIEEIQDKLNIGFDLTSAEEKKLKNEMFKLQHELDKLLVLEEKASVKTPIPAIIENLSKYRLSDLHSLAEQISNGAWDDYEALSRDELESALGEELTARLEDLEIEEQSNKKFGFYVRPIQYIQYSDRVKKDSAHELMGEAERLKKENAKLKADFERLKERLNLEKQVTHGNYFNEKQLNAVANHLRTISKSTYNKAYLVEELRGIYSYIAHSPNITYDELNDMCYTVAKEILSEAEPKVIVEDFYMSLIKEIRNTRISLDDVQKGEARNRFGKNYNRYFFGKVILAKDATPLDVKWQEWSSEYPTIFKEDSTDQIGDLFDAIDRLHQASETVVEYNTEEQAQWLANEIYNQYWNVSTIKTTADKYDKKLRLLNFEHRRMMTELREDYNTRMKERLEAQKLVDEMHYKRKLRENSKKAKEQSEKIKLAYDIHYGKLLRNLEVKAEQRLDKVKNKADERFSQYKENAERKTRIQRITSNSLALNEMLVKNSKDKHIPEVLKEPVINLLNAIDFSSKRLIDQNIPTNKDISLAKTLSKVKDMMKDASDGNDELTDLYGHGMDDDIKAMVDSVDDIMRTIGDNEFVLNKMTLSDLKTLEKMVKTIKYAVNKVNKFHVVNHAKGIANLSQESMLHLNSLGKGKIYDGKKGAIKKLLDWGNALPYYVFKRFGSGGMKVYEALQDGWDKLAFNVKKVLDYAHEAYTSEEVKAWEKEIKTFKILIPATEEGMARDDYEPQYQTIQMTVSQIMSMYCLNKREQARKHLFQGGIRVADFKNSKGEIISQSDGIIFTEKDIPNILNSLTDRQKAVADKLQEFMNTVCSEWGNEVSMLRFGYKAFGEENYFPVQSDKNNLAVNDETEQNNSLFKLLNMSFTKSLNENANNRIVISNIFDVFAQHSSDMAKYNALALPVLDSFKWYNYTEKHPVADGTFITHGVKQSIEYAFGKDGQNYFTTFLKDINGQQEVTRDTLGKGFFSNAKIAAVGANLRVMCLQPTSYFRASAIIDNRYLAKALGHKPKIKMAEKYCGIALWKSMGYFDTNIKRGIESQIKHDEALKDKLVEKSMKGAEIADKITWGYLWNACDLEVRDKRTDLKVGSEEFYQAVAHRLREIIYATQVVDSTMTRSHMMRSTDRLDKMLTAFGSETTLSYNMLQDAFMEYSLDKRSMGKKEAVHKNKKRIARILFSYTVTNAIAALVESGFDAFRDDDDEEMDVMAFLKLYLSNFASDMSITGKIPYIKELHSFIKGFGSSRSDTQWMEHTTNALIGWWKLFNGKGNASTVIKNSSKSISELFGIPFYNAYRDAMAALNKLDLFTAEDLNEIFEDFFD